MVMQGPMLRVKKKKKKKKERKKKKKNRAIVFLRTERKVRVALRAIRYQIALDWTADENFRKNNK